MKKKTNWIIFSLIVLSMGFCPPISAEVVDRIVAIVNDDIVTLVQLNKATAPYRKKLEVSGYSNEKKQEVTREINQKVINGLIDKTLTQQEAKRYQISVSDAELDRSVENVMKNKSLSPAEFSRALEQDGITLEEYRENIKEQILQSKIINNAVKSKVIISDTDIKEFYQANQEKYSGQKKYHLRNILMDTEDEADKIKSELDKKKDFITLAKDYSTASNASDGGDLGLFDISNFSENLKESISKLNKGDYTDVIKTPQGFQIFYIEDIVFEGGKTYEQAFDEIHGELYREQVEKKFESWLESLKKKATIKIML